MEREGGADIILGLMVVKERRLYAEAYDSLFIYCTRELGFSKSTAYRRKVVVDAAERYPQILEWLRDGRLHLCAAAAVAPHLRGESVGEILAAIEGLSHREAESVLARRSKIEPVELTLGSGPVLGCEIGSGPVTGSEVARDPPRGVLPPKKQKMPRTVVRSSNAETSRISVSFHHETVASLRRAREISRGKSDDEIMAEALALYLAKKDPLARHARRLKRKPRVTKPRKVAPSTERRGTTAERDTAYARASGRCEHVSQSGTRCGSPAFVETHHKQSHATGGASNAENFQILCSTHHRTLSEQEFGKWPAEA